MLAVAGVSADFPTSASAAIEEVVVTATRRELEAQTVPVAVNALTEDYLDSQNITGFDDYVMTVPSLSRSGVAPGRNQLYIRGISQGGPQFEAATAGPEPSAAIYLDEQPVTTLGANLDVHIYDVARVEVLPGPQGTLFGASAQSGALRIITNKPDPSAFYGGVDASGSFTEHGEFNNSVETFINVPLGDRVAVRGVFYNVHDAGYIDAINGVQVSPVDNGFGFGTVIGSVVDGPDPSFVEDNQNEITKLGFRASVLGELNDDWKVQASVMHQKLQIDGVFQHDPEENGDLNIVNLYPNEREDKFTQVAWTVEGKAGALDVLYTGAILDRDVDEIKDFTDYSEVGAYQDFYTCNYYAIFYFKTGTVANDCRSQVYGFRSVGNYNTMTHEIRVLTPADWRLRATGGVFYQEDEADTDLEFLYPNGADPALAAGLFGLPGSPLLPDRDPSVSFVNKLKRKKDQIAVYGEFAYGLLPDTLTLTFGMRYYDIKSSIDGFNIGLALPFRDLSNFPNLDENGFIFKGNIAWTPADNLLFYATYSEGFRPGGFNRTPGVQRNPNIPVPAYFVADVLKNYEIGWKTDLFDRRLRFNGAAYVMTRDKTQISIFDAGVAGATFAVNGPSSKTIGVEVDFTAAPTDQLTVFGGLSYNESELDGDFLNLSGVLLAQEGTELPFAPKFQGHLGGRYNFMVAGQQAFLRGIVRHTGSSYTSVIETVRDKQHSYTTGDIGAGLEFDKWWAELYVNNVWDERAELFIDSEFLGGRITPNRPRTLGLRLSYRF